MGHFGQLPGAWGSGVTVLFAPFWERGWELSWLAALETTQGPGYPENLPSLPHAKCPNTGEMALGYPKARDVP